MVYYNLVVQHGEFFGGNKQKLLGKGIQKMLNAPGLIDLSFMYCDVDFMSRLCYFDNSDEVLFGLFDKFAGNFGS